MLRKSLLTVLWFYHEFPGKQELLQSFAPMKNRLESHSCSFLNRNAKVKTEETDLVGLEDGSRSLLCHRFAVLALVSSHRTRSIKHRFTGYLRL